MDATAESFRQEGDRARAAGRPRAATAAYRRSLALTPAFMPALANLALVLAGEDALDQVRRAVVLAPSLALLHLNLGNAFSGLARGRRAASAFRRALGLDPAYGEAWLNLGVALHGEGLIAAAAAAAARALAVRPSYGEAWNNLGNAWRDQGRVPAAIAAYEKAMAANAGYADAARNRLAARLYLDDDEERAGEEARAFARRYGPPSPLPPAPLPSAPIDRDPERRIRVGLLSSDLRDHPVGRNLASFFQNRDPGQIELVGYDSGPGDRMSGWFQARADLWRPVAHLTDRAIAELVRADRIDVLVGLAGRFDRNRPLVLAWRAAPVQAAMHDGGPSGLGFGDDPAIDAWITDAVLHPRSLGDRAGGDRLLRLPLFYSFPVPDRPPASRRPRPEGAVVLASFSNPAKLSSPLLEAWGRILAEVPAARLQLKYRTWCADPGIQARVAGGIAGAGGDPERIEFLAGADDAEAHLTRYGGVDLALDPFPFSGATTSFEALAMGVPVLTLAGRAAIGRTTAAILGPLGLDELVSGSAEDYVRRACTLAFNPLELTRLKDEVAIRLLTSPLLDAAAHAAALAQAFRRLWRDWCKAAGPR